MDDTPKRSRGRSPVKEGEASVNVGVTLAASTVQTIDEIVGPYGNRSRFVRRAVERYITQLRKKAAEKSG